MSAILFLFDIIAFLVVVAWAYTNDAPGKSGEGGPLGMKLDAAEGGARGPLQSPRWKQGAAAAMPPVATGGRSTPRWRRSVAPPRPQVR